MSHSGPLTRLSALLVPVLGLSFISAVMLAEPAHSATPDDAPVLLTPKGEHDNGEDEQNFDKLRDAYYWSRLLAGDDELTLGQAATLRSNAASAATKISNATQAGAPRGGTWASVGPDPIVQQARTSGGLEAVSGRVGALAVRSDGTIILGAAQGGVWTYDQNTKVWTSRTNDAQTQSVGALAIAPSNENIVYMGSGEGALSGDSYYGDGVYRSADGGVTWTHVSGDLFDGQSTSGIVVDPANPNHLYVATLRGRGGARRTSAPTAQPFGIWESSDGGSTWTLRKGTTDELHGATDLVADPQNFKVLWASFWGDGIYRSTDGGVTWASALGNLPAGNYLEGGTRFALGISHPSGPHATVYTGFDYFDLSGRYHRGQIYKSTDDGATWTTLPTGSGTNSVLDYCGTQCFYDNVVKPDPTNPDVLYVEGSYGYNFSPQSGGVFRSTDGGQTWKSLGYDLHPDFHALAFQPNNTQHVVIGNDGGVWQSFSGGGRNNAGDPLSKADWEDLNGTVDPNTAALRHSTGLAITQFTSIATVPNIPGQYWGGSQDNGTERKSLVNNRWFDQAGGDGGQVIVDQSTVNTLNPGVPAYVFQTYYGISPYRFDPSTANAFNGMRAINGGINMSDRSEFYVPWIQNRSNTNQMFLGTYRLYRTNNAETASAGNVHWTPISGDLSSGCTGAAPNGARGCFISAIGMADGGDAVYVATDDGPVWVSPNAATSDNPTWQRIGVNSLPNRPATQFAVDRSNWRTAYISYAGFGAATPSNRGHVFATSDGGAHWRDISSNLPDIPVNSVVLDPSDDNTLYAGTDVGAFVTVNGGQTWKRLGSGMPNVAVWQLDYDPSHGVLAAGTHGRGAYALTNRTALPALVVSTADSGRPVGPGTTIDYTITVKNLGNADATGVTVSDPLPSGVSFVSADHGGTLGNTTVRWSNLTVPAGGSLALHVTGRISPSLSSSVTAIVNDGIIVKSDQGVDATGSPHTTPIAPAHAMTVAPASQAGAARVGSSASYQLQLTNHGYQSDTYALATTDSATVYDPTCTTALTTTPSVPAGDSLAVCVKVPVAADAANGSTTDATVTATSTADPSVSGSATFTTIAVSVDTLLVDEDGNAPDVKAYYENALAADNISYSYWDLKANPVIPQTLLTAHKNVIWYTGNSYPAPIGPYESELKAFLDGGGRLFMNGQDLLDQAAGTTAFVHDYLHINWNGTEAQNDKATSAVHGVAGNAVSDGIGAVTLDHSVLGANFEDQITPISPAASAFTDDTGATDGLTVAAGSYKVVFLAFPFEAYGSASDKSDLLNRVMAYFGS